MNTSTLIQYINTTQAKVTSQEIIKTTIKTFITHPFIFIIVAVTIILAIIVFMKQFLDDREGGFQTILGKTALFVIVFALTLMLLIVVDSGDKIGILKNLFGRLKFW